MPYSKQPHGIPDGGGRRDGTMGGIYPQSPTLKHPTSGNTRFLRGETCPWNIGCHSAQFVLIEELQETFREVTHPHGRLVIIVHTYC